MGMRLWETRSKGEVILTRFDVDSERPDRWLLFVSHIHIIFTYVSSN